MKVLLWDAILRRAPVAALLSFVMAIGIAVAMLITPDDGLDDAYGQDLFSLVPLCVLLLVAGSSIVLPQEVAIRRSKSLRVLPVEEKDVARSLWILSVVMYPAITFSVATPLLFGSLAPDDWFWDDLLLWMAWNSLFFVSTALMFCSARFFPSVLPAQIRGFRDGIGYLLSPLGGAVAFLFLFRPIYDLIWIMEVVLYPRWILPPLLFLPMLAMLISYWSAVGVVRAQRRFESEARISKGLPLPGGRRMRFGLPVGIRRALLLPGGFAWGIFFYVLIFGIIGYPPEDTKDDLAFLYVASLPVALYVGPRRAHTCCSLRPLPLSRHRITRYLMADPLIAMLGLFSGYLYATSMWNTSLNMHQPHGRCFFRLRGSPSPRACSLRWAVSDGRRRSISSVSYSFFSFPSIQH